MLLKHHPYLIPATKFLLLSLVISFWFYCCQSKTGDNVTRDSKTESSASNDQVPAKSNYLQRIYLNLEIEKLFWQNRLAMSRNPAMDLAVDLVDSMVYLEFKGVILRKTKISRYEISPSMSYLKKFSSYKSWLDGPFILVQDSVSSIPKEPVYIKDLTTHSLEYFDDWTYFNRLENEAPVHFLLEYDRGLFVQVDQDSDSISSAPLSGHWFRFSIPAADAKAIYRALAKPSELALRY